MMLTPWGYIARAFLIFAGSCQFALACLGAAEHNLLNVALGVPFTLLWVYNFSVALRWPAQRAKDGVLEGVIRDLEKHFDGLYAPVAFDLGTGEGLAYTRPPLPRPANRIEEEIRRRLASGDAT